MENRDTEHIFIIAYTLFCMFLFLIDLWEHDSDLAGITCFCLIAGWLMFFRQFKSYRTRAWIMCILTMTGYFRHSMEFPSFGWVFPSFAVLIVMLGLYGMAAFLYVELAVYILVIVYQTAVLHAVDLTDEKTVIGFMIQFVLIPFLSWLIRYYIMENQIMQKQLLDTIETLRDAEHGKDDFMANVSHEIRTPLNTICGMSELAMREEIPDAVREELFHIQAAGRELQVIVSDVLDFSELEAGRMTLHEEEYNFSSVINDVINMAIAQNEEKKLELIVDCDAEIPFGLYGDHEKLCRVLYNLVSNAIKFTEEGCVLIRVVMRLETYGGNLCIEVEDTGIGMDEPTREKLFTAFNQYDTRKNRTKGGVGLGIAISHRMVDLMHGFISVKSVPGKGTRFRVVVPQKITDERPMISVEKRDQIRVLVYINPERQQTLEVRTGYLELVGHMAQQLHISMTQCISLHELKNRLSRGGFTHLFITIEEYRENPEYFTALSQDMPVILVVSREDGRDVRGNFLRIYKPFYVLSVAAILNGESMVQRIDGSHYQAGHFVAPDANVLVVDDSMMNLKVVEGLLRPYKIRLFTAMSGQEALQMLDWGHYDLIFMDHMMPGMDGVETLHRIRKKQGSYYQNVPVVALTANAIGGAREMFLAEGFDDFVAKPVEISSLERVLKKYLKTEQKTESGIHPEADLKTEPGIHPEADKKAESDIYPEADKKTEPDSKAEDESSYQIDLEQGLLYCGGEMEDYREIVGIYYTTGCEKIGELDRLFAEKDWKNYTVIVHAVKSTSLSIGAASLSELAKEQELAGKKFLAEGKWEPQEEEAVLARHRQLLEEYRQVLDEIDRRWRDGAC